MSDSLKVGIVGTGFAAQRRAEALQQDNRSNLIAFSGYSAAKTIFFAEKYQITPLKSWQELVDLSDLDLVVICTINQEHGKITRAALESGKHVIVEYPLALNTQEASELIKLAENKGLLLHVEHIEILGGLHQTIRKFLPKIGQVFFARYTTINPQQSVSQKWTYNHELYGFPLLAALSRIHRFTNLFGKVASVSCQSRFWNTANSQYYQSCLCSAQLKFIQGLIAEIVYGKGEVFWHRSRDFELHGEQGSLIFEGDRGMLIQGETKQVVDGGSRRGLFAKDTAMVLDHLLAKKPLYISPQASYYALKVADAAKVSAESGTTINL